MSAFEALFQQYHGLVFRTAYLMTGNREETEDILQEVFVSMWKSRHTFNPVKGRVTTWLHRITINRCAMKCRKKQPACLSLERITEEGFQLQRAENSELPDETLARKQEYERLMKSMNSLDSKHRPVLVLRYLNDLSYDEIARVLDIPLGTVKSRINQGIRTLRAQMGVQRGEAST